jgi:hypothetical protein
MTESAPKAKCYRECAERLRKSATAAASADSRNAFVSMALNYEQLANAVERAAGLRKIESRAGFGSTL